MLQLYIRQIWGVQDRRKKKDRNEEQLALSNKVKEEEDLEGYRV